MYSAVAWSVLVISADRTVSIPTHNCDLNDYIRDLVPQFCLDICERTATIVKDLHS